MATGGIGRSGTDDNRRPECVACLEILDTDRRLPLSLDCRHDVCRTCAPRLLTGTQIICHICRHPTYVPRGDVSKLRPNYGLKDLLDKMCANCGNLSMYTCSSCNSKVCNRCLELHTQGHILLAVMESALDPAVDMVGKFSRMKEDTRKIFDRYIDEARRAREGRLSEIDRVLESNKNTIQTWQDNLPATLTTERNQLKDELETLFTSNFTQQDLDTIKERASSLQKKLDDVTKPFISHIHLEIHTDLTSQIAGSTSLKTTTPDYSQARVKHEVGGLGEDLGKFNGPLDICQVSSGNFVVSDMRNDRCCLLDPQLKPISTFGSKGTSAGQLNHPTGVATDSKGLVYVASGDNHTIQVFNQQSQHQRSFGAHGTDPGQFNGPHGLAFDSHDNLVISDTHNGRVQILSSSGEYLRTLAVTGAAADQLRSKPYMVLVTGNDNVVVKDWLTDGVGGNLYFYTLSGNLTTTLLRGPDTFGGAAGTATDCCGNLLVCDLTNGCVVVFDPSLKRLCQFGVKGLGLGQLGMPISLAVTQDGNVAVVDLINNKIILYEVPKL